MTRNGINTSEGNIEAVKEVQGHCRLKLRLRDQNGDYQIDEPRTHESEVEAMQNQNRDDEPVERDMMDQNPVPVKTEAVIRPKRQRNPPKRYEDYEKC